MTAADLEFQQFIQSMSGTSYADVDSYVRSSSDTLPIINFDESGDRLIINRVEDSKDDGCYVVSKNLCDDTVAFCWIYKIKMYSFTRTLQQ